MKDQPIRFATLTKRTNYPKLGYIIYRLKEQGIACRLFGESWHAPILEVDKTKLGEAWQVLGEKHGRYTLDDMRDDNPKFAPFAEERPFMGELPSFVCPRCGAKSYNPNDIRERYCGRCHVFVDDELPEKEDDLPADWPPMDDDPASMTGEPDE